MRWKILIWVLQIYPWVCQWKNFENRLAFGEVMSKILVSCSFDSRCGSKVYVTIIRSHTLPDKCNHQRSAAVTRSGIYWLQHSVWWMVMWLLPIIVVVASFFKRTKCFMKTCNICVAYVLNESKLVAKCVMSWKKQLTGFSCTSQWVLLGICQQSVLSLTPDVVTSYFFVSILCLLIPCDF